MNKRYEISSETAKLLGTMSDSQLAQRMGVSLTTIRKHRVQRGIKAWRATLNTSRWTSEMVAQLGTSTDREVAAQLGLSRPVVENARTMRGIPSFFPRKEWTAAEIAVLGTAADRVVAQQLGVSRVQVHHARKTRGISAWSPEGDAGRWTDYFLQQLGKMPDTELAKFMGAHPKAVAAERHRRDVPIKRVYLLDDYLPQLGTKSDAKIAAEYGVHMSTVANARKRYGIPSNTQRRAWKEEELKLLGRYSDAAVARMTGRNRAGVKMERANRRIPGIDPRDALRLYQEACVSTEAPLR